MAKKKKQVKKGVDTPVLKEIKVSNKRPEFKIGDGHEDQPYQKGTMQDLGREFYDEYGMMSSPLTSDHVNRVVGAIVLALIVTALMFIFSPLV